MSGTKRTALKVGDRFNRLTCVALYVRRETHKGYAHAFVCDCGASVIARFCDVKNGAVKSCGCLSAERTRTHGRSSSREYRSWITMRQRCNNPNATGYEYWGGRGVRVCSRWDDFELFLADMGPRPEGMTLDRFPNKDGDYEPGNCRWATPSDQNSNLRKKRHYKGKPCK